MASVGDFGALWIAVSVVLAGFAVAGSLFARRYGREPGEWTLWLPATILVAAFPFLMSWLVGKIVSEPGPDAGGDSPVAIPDWLFADSTAMAAMIVAAAGAVSWVICFAVWARLQHQMASGVDAALRREMRGNGADKTASASGDD